MKSRSPLRDRTLSDQLIRLIRPIRLIDQCSALSQARRVTATSRRAKVTPMAVLCSHCGEELMGAVNRCWRCGKALVVHAGPQDIPPVRRSPITGPLDAPLEATILSESPPAPVGGMRRGSPFVANVQTLRVSGPIPTPAPTETPRPPRTRTFESQFAAQFAAITSMVVGIAALALAHTVPIASLCLAIVVLGFGIWGLFSQRRGIAIFGLILGCCALAWGGFGTVVQLYQVMYGVHPFATSLPVPPASPPGS